MTLPVASHQIPTPPATGKSPESEPPSPARKRQAPGEPDKQLKTRIDTDITQLSTDEKLMIEKLKARDREVRAHEQAHVAAGGHHITSGASYQFQTGPDGRKYRIGGEVSLDVSRVAGSPEKTAAKMQTIQNAALAPTTPSATDKAVAARARQVEMQARIEIYKELAELKETSRHGSLSLQASAIQITGTTIDINI